jgi:spore germination cell wall hydrolase CwlJ-like protein
LSAPSRSLQRSQLAGSFTRGSKPPTATLIATAAQSRLSDISTPAQQSAPNATIAESQGGGRNYLALIDVDHAAAEERCLDEAIYFEARGESEAGQAAVAQVVLNRVESGHYPASICGVVYQKQRRRNSCQFSFACQRNALRVAEPVSWNAAVRIAREVLLGSDYSTEVGGSTHYLADYAHPRWARTLQRMDVIGHHIFYQAAPAATLVCVRHVGDRGIGFAPTETVEVNSPS